MTLENIDNCTSFILINNNCIITTHCILKKNIPTEKNFEVGSNLIILPTTLFNLYIFVVFLVCKSKTRIKELDIHAITSFFFSFLQKEVITSFSYIMYNSTCFISSTVFKSLKFNIFIEFSQREYIKSSSEI